MAEGGAASAADPETNVIEMQGRRRGKASTTIHRATKEERGQYTIVSNEILNNPALSLEARGALAYLLSRPDDWNIRLDHLEKTFNIGREKMQRIMRELRDAGYAQLSSSHAVNGRFGGKKWVVFEIPDGASAKLQSAPIDLLSETGNRQPGKPSVGARTDSRENRQPVFPTDGKADCIPIKENLLKNDFNLPLNPHAQTPTWAEFQSAWPWAPTESPHAARDVWEGLSSEGQALAIKSIPVVIGKTDEQGVERPFAEAYLGAVEIWSDCAIAHAPAVAPPPCETSRNPARVPHPAERGTPEEVAARKAEIQRMAANWRNPPIEPSGEVHPSLATGPPRE